MNLLKKSQFAKALGVRNSNINVYESRNKIVVNNDGMIDTTNPVNKIFIETRKANGKIFDLNLAFSPRDKSQLPIIKEVKKEVKEKIDLKEIIEDENHVPQKQRQQKSRNADISLVEQKMELEIKKMKVQIEIDTLKKLKIEGQLVPVDAIQNIFMWAIDTFHNTYQQEVTGLANIFEADHKKFIQITKDLSQRLNKIKADAKENLLLGIEGIIEEYQEVRGRGEKK
jgi:hypothetical protein